MPPQSVENVVGDGDYLLLSAAFEAYRRDVIVFRSLSASTEERHYITLKSIMSFIGMDINVYDLTFEHVRDWKLDMEKRRLSPTTVRGYLMGLRVVLGYLRYKGYKCLDPSQLPLPKRVDQIPAVLSPEQVTILIDVVPILRDKLIISMLYSTGLRISELLSLKRSDVIEDFFTVLGKGGRSRLCFIDARTRGLLNLYLKKRSTGYNVMIKSHSRWTDRVRYHVEPDHESALFISEHTTRKIGVSAVQKLFQEARVNAGFDFPIHPHTMRHSFATNLMHNGCHIRVLRDMLGHKSIATTEMYLHVYNPELREAFAKYHSI